MWCQNQLENDIDSFSNYEQVQPLLGEFVQFYKKSFSNKTIKILILIWSETSFDIVNDFSIEFIEMTPFQSKNSKKLVTL